MLKALSYHLIAKIFVVLSAYVLHFALGKVLTIEEYGVIGTIISFCNFYYMFLTNGVRQGISKSLSSNQFDNRQVIVRGMLLQTALCLLLSGINFALAPAIAKAFGEPAFVEYVRFLSLLILLTGIYFALTGSLNGLKLFFLESIVIIVYPLLRLAAVPLAALVNNKPIGVIIGFSIASFLSAILAWRLLVHGKGLQKVSDRKKVTTRYMLQVSKEFIVMFAAVTLVLNMDTFFLQYVSKNITMTGYYTGVHTFSLVPYYLVSAFYLVVLPFISEKSAQNAWGEVQTLVKKNMNLMVTFILPIVVLISISAPELLAAFYNPEYYQAGTALSVLCSGTFLLSMFAFLNVILNGMNCKRVSVCLSAVMVILDIILLNVFISKGGIVGAAWATTLSAGVGCLGAIIYLWKKIGCFFDWKIVSKSIALITIFVVLCRVILTLISTPNLIVLMLLYAGLGVLYLVCAIVLKLIKYGVTDETK